MIRMVQVSRLSFVLCILPAWGYAGPSLGSWHGRIIETRSLAMIQLVDLTAKLSRADFVVMGEKHYTPAVQQAQALVIESVVLARDAKNHFTTAWEFLNFTSQLKIQEAYAKFVAGQIDALGFLAETQGSVISDSYVPILESTRSLGGQLIGINLSRKEKEPVVQYGIGAADPKLVPPGFEMGGKNYHDRFIKVMVEGGHASPEQAENYWAAQCLSDDVMAHHSILESLFQPVFLVTGSFHADYGDGVVARLKARAVGKGVQAIRFIDASDFHEDELLGLLHDPVYGDIAEFAYFVNEPSRKP